MADRLEALLEHFGVAARVFHSGAVCGINDVPTDRQAGFLHLVRSGRVEVVHDGAEVLQIDEPSLLMYPRPQPHRFVTDTDRGADLACAHLRFEGGRGNPVAAALPPFVCLPLRQLAGSEAVLDLLFDEAFDQRCGRTAVLERLFEVVLIQILRQLMETGQAPIGLLAGMGHPRLRHALIAIHEQPANDWSLELLASQAGMSRSAFADTFRDTVGDTPGGYLQSWRIALAKKALRAGKGLKHVAQGIGYGSEAALSRAFKAHSGLSPRAWLKEHAD